MTLIKKYPRTMHLSSSKGLSNDDRMITPENEQKLLSDEIIILEKLDGSNACITKLAAYGRSHGAPTQNPWDKDLLEKWNILKNEIGDFEIYGENMYGIHSIEYSELTNYFYIFGIRTPECEWLDWKSVEEWAELLGVPTVPVLWRGKTDSKGLKEIISILVEGGSTLGGQMEGVVVKTPNSYTDEEWEWSIAKWVRKGHVQTSEHWTRSWKKAKIKSTY